jgi:thiol-disulfide isomerase/thioredoxin
MNKHVEIYTTATCQPCKMMAVFLEDLYEMIDIRWMRYEEIPEQFKKVRVMSTPTMLFYLDGEEQYRYEGFMPKPLFVDYYNKIGKEDEGTSKEKTV